LGGGVWVGGMAKSDAQQNARWWDRTIAVLWVGNLAWVTWQLGGFVPGPMTLGLPVAFLTAAMVLLRWWVIVPEGAPKGWWYPLPFLAWVTVHMAGLAELPSRGWLHGWHLWSGAAAYWTALHLVRRPSVGRATLAGVGVVALGVVVAGIYQRAVDPTWLPLGREQVGSYLGRSAGTFGNPNHAAAWLAMVLMFMGGLSWSGVKEGGRWGRGLAGLVAVACLVGVGLSFSRGVGLAVLMATVLAVVTRSSWGWFRRAAVATGLVIGAAVLVGAGYQQSNSVQQRIDSLVEHGGERTRPLIWGIAWDLWQERPVTGYGGNSFEMLMEQHRPEGLWESPHYAHNEYLNLLSDYGVVGGLLVALGVGLVVRRRLTRRQHPWPGTGLGLLVIGLASGLDFHLQSPAILWLTAWGVAGWVGERGSRGFTSAKHVGPQVLAIGAAAVALLSPIIAAVPSLRSEELRWRAREQLDQLKGVPDPAAIRAVADAATRSLSRAVSIDPRNERAWMDYSYSLSLQKFGDVDAEPEQGRLAEEAAWRALESSELVAEHWLRLGMARQLQGRWANSGPAFGRAVTLAPRQPVMWYYQGHHFSLRPTTHALARAALATCLRLDPGYHSARLLKADLERSP